MKKTIALFTFLIFVVIATIIYQRYATNASSGKSSSQAQNTATVTIRNYTFKLYFATSSEEKQIGLSSRQSLPQDYGMLFQFGTPDYYIFWMKNMKFPIDIIFIRDNKIVSIIENAPPLKPNDQKPLTYKPKSPADTVLEINSGLSKKYGFKIGDEVKIKK